jgi:hypothetical protein
MELENKMLSEVSQVQKLKVAYFLSYVKDKYKYKYYHIIHICTYIEHV